MNLASFNDWLLLVHVVVTMTDISVSDLYGKQLIQVSEYLKFDNTFELNLGELGVSGIYFVTIKNGTSRLVQKLVIQ